MSGKGDTYRSVNLEKFNSNFDAIFNKKHMHAEAIHAYAEGKKLEFRVAPGATHYGSTNDWFPCDNPDFHPNFEYRVRKDNVSS